MKKFLSLALSLCMVFAMSVCAYATEISFDVDVDSTTEDFCSIEDFIMMGELFVTEMTVPVNLTTTNGGINNYDSDFTPTKLNVVVPTSLPMAMSDDGTVVTASDCKIVNKSYGAVRVKSVTLSAADDWNLTAFGDKSTLAGEKVDSNKLGFALSIGGGKQVGTANDNATQQLITSPIEGCYMTGIGDTANNFVKIDYDAIVTPLSGAVNNATVANVVFVIEWDMVE